MLAKAALVCVGLALSGAAAFQNPQVFVGQPVAEHNCLSRGLMVDGRPFVSYGCFVSDLEAKATWKRNIIFLADVFHAIDHFQSEPLMRSAEDYRTSGSEDDRIALTRDLITLSEMLHLAAQTAHLTGTYLPESASRAQNLERNYLWAAAVLDGPLTWSLPSTQSGMERWAPALRALINAVRPDVEEQYRLAEIELHKCDPVAENDFRFNLR